MIRIEEFLTKEAVSPFRRWFDALDHQAAAWVAIAIDRPGEGNTSNAKALGEGVSELRINRGPGYRVYFGWDGKGACHPARRRHQEATTERYADSVTPLARLQGAQGGRTRQEDMTCP
jgi:putative addiction module killer protein